VCEGGAGSLKTPHVDFLELAAGLDVDMRLALVEGLVLAKVTWH
jgi:hypothetical protein